MKESKVALDQCKSDLLAFQYYSADASLYSLFKIITGYKNYISILLSYDGCCDLTIIIRDYNGTEELYSRAVKMYELCGSSLKDVLMGVGFKVETNDVTSVH